MYNIYLFIAGTRAFAHALAAVNHNVMNI